MSEVGFRNAVNPLINEIFESVPFAGLATTVPSRSKLQPTERRRLLGYS